MRKLEYLYTNITKYLTSNNNNIYNIILIISLNQFFNILFNEKEMINKNKSSHSLRVTYIIIDTHNSVFTLITHKW